MNSFHISTNKDELNIAFIHHFLSEQTHWAKNIPIATVQKSIQHSLCFGGYVNGKQIAFARVITDYATFANLVDVFVTPEHREKKYSKAIMQAIMSHPELQNLRRFTLATSDAHGLYCQYGFTPLKKPQTYMERYHPNIYTTAS